MRKFVWLFILLFLVLIVSNASYAEWQTPTVVTVSQEGGQTSKLGKYGDNVYVLNTDTDRNLKFYKSTDGGNSFNAGVTLGSTVRNGTELEMKVGPNGYIHIFYEEDSDGIMYYRRSTDNGNTFSGSIALTSGMDWADSPHCFVKDSNNIYLIFRAYNSPKSELYFVKSTDGGASFDIPTRITNNSIQEDQPRLVVFNSTIYVAYLDYYDTKNLYLIKSTDGGSSFSSAVRINQTDKKTDFGFEMDIDSNGNIFVPYKDTVNDYEGDLYVARSTDGGSTFDYITAADSTYRYQMEPEISIFNDDIYLSWYDYRDNNAEVYLARSIDGGESYETNFNVSSNSDDQGIQDMVVDNNGIYILASADYGYTTKLYMTSYTTSQPPSVTTNSASNITDNSATLNGTVNANDLSTTAWFEYDTTSGAYTNTTSTQSVSGSSDTSISSEISGPTSDTIYYYRIVAENSAGTSYGDEVSFTTLTPADTTLPSGSMIINNGDTYTKSTLVTLSLSATDDTGVTGYYLSESSSTPFASDSGWTFVTSTTNYSASVSYTLSTGDGSKTIYVWYKDAAGNVSDSASDSITLDTTVPTVTITSPTSSSNYETSSSTIDLSGSASDATSGISSITWSNSRTGESGTASGTTSWSVSNILLSIGSNLITVNAIDNAGNTGKDTITVTVSVPTPTSTSTPIPTPTLIQTPLFTPIPCTDDYEPNDSFDTAYGPLTSGESYEGKICSLLDKDYFKFEVTGRGYIELELSVPSDRDYDLYLYDPEETQIASSNFGTGNTETITQTVFTTGTYYIGVIGYESDYDEDQTYTLSGTWTVTRQTPAPTVTPEVTATVTQSVTPTPGETGAIIGTVVDAVTSAPISNATVSTDTGGYFTTTNPSGRYALTNIKAGDYTLTATASGYASLSQSITVTADIPTQVNFSLSPLISPTPTPEPTGICEVYGFVIDEYYKDLKGVSVGINGENYNNSTKTDEDGYFEFVDFVGGEYTITFEKKGYKRQTQEVSLEEGEEYDMGTIVMKQGFSGKIYGTVTDVESEPIKSAKVKLKSKGNATNVKRKEKTDKDGFFEFDDLEDGTYIIQANKKGYKKSKIRVKLEDGEGEEIEIVLEEK